MHATLHDQSFVAAGWAGVDPCAGGQAGYLNQQAGSSVCGRCVACRLYYYYTDELVLGGPCHSQLLPVVDALRCW